MEQDYCHARRGLPPSVLLALFDREPYYPILMNICELLHIADIIVLTRTCRRLSGLYKTLLPLLWNVDRALKRFVSKPVRFRQQMAKHDVLVSGSVALQYFERVVWKESDLDIYVQTGLNAEAMAEYLVTAEGHSGTETRNAHEYMKPQTIEVSCSCT